MRLHQMLLVAAILVPVPTSDLLAATPAQTRLTAAAELQRTFDASLLKNMELKFIVRGPNCDLLHVEALGLNLYPEMVEALANGTVIYGKVLPGGVNSFAFGHGFRDVAYTNRADKVFRAYGPSRLKRDSALKLRVCTDAMAASVTAAAPSGPIPTAPPFVPLSWATATSGQKLYNGSYKHEATIVTVNKSAGLITVKYVRTGSTEPKRLESVAALWYVRK